jgi:GT2 family glycosyltransferase
MRRMRAKIVTRGLSRDRVFEQSAADKLASAAMSIIVPIHDAPMVTRRCLASLERYAAEADIVLVDDGSKLPETVATIGEYSHRNGWKVISKGAATGHSAACWTGTKLASRPYLCLLNSDTVITPWCWRPILKAFQMNPTIGVVGPYTSRSSNRQTLAVAQDCRFEWNDSQICSYAERLRHARLFSSTKDLPWAAGFAFFIRLNLWQELGGFDQSLADYGNELDLCKRIRNCGYRIVCARRSYIHHFAAQSYGQLMNQDEVHKRKLAGIQYVLQKHKASAG